MEIITNSDSDKELKSAKIVKSIIDKYKHEIPLLTNKIKIQTLRIINHNIPSIILSTDPLKYKYSNKIFLYLLIRENFKYFAANSKPINKTLLSNKYRDEFIKNSQLKRESSNKLKDFINNIIIIFNEITITHKIIEIKRLNYIYKYFSNDYRATRQWVLNNFDKLEKDLIELNLIWNKK